MRFLVYIIILIIPLALFVGCSGSFGADGFPDEVVVTSKEESSAESSAVSSIDESSTSEDSADESSASEESSVSEASNESSAGVSVAPQNSDDKPNTMRLPYQATVRAENGKEVKITEKKDLQEITDMLQQWFPDGRIMSGRQPVNLDTVSDIMAEDYSIELVYNGYASDNVFRTCNRLLIKAPKKGDTLIYRYIHGEYVSDPFAPVKSNVGVAKMHDLAKKWLFVS